MITLLLLLLALLQLLKKMVADRDLEIDVLKEITRKKW